MSQDLVAPAEIPAEPDVISPLRVLLIEDNAIDARLIQIMLSEAGASAAMTSLMCAELLEIELSVYCRVRVIRWTPKPT